MYMLEGCLAEYTAQVTLQVRRHGHQRHKCDSAVRGKLEDFVLSVAA